MEAAHDEGMEVGFLEELQREEIVLLDFYRWYVRIRNNSVNKHFIGG